MTLEPPFPHQLEFVRKAIQEHRWNAWFDPGLGKTRSSIMVAERVKPKRMLIVCPKKVLRHWESELGLWWLDHPSIRQVRPGLKTKLDVPIQICSWGSLHRIPERPRFEMYIFDEIHNISHSTSNRSKEARRVLGNGARQHSIILGLSGTPLPNEPKNLWNQIDTIWPRALGRSPYKFYGEFCNVVSNDYAKYAKVWGVKEGKEEELAQLLELFGTRVTSDMVPGLPIPSISPILMDGAGIKEIREAAEEHSRFAILTYRVEAAETIGAQLSTTHDVTIITGERYPNAAKRSDVANASTVLVATLDSIGEGINLKDFDAVILAEIHPKPHLNIQGMMRFTRLGDSRGAVGIPAYILIQPGTDSERNGNYLARKLRDMGKILSLNGSSNAVADTLDPQSFTADMLAKLDSLEILDDWEDL